MGGTGFTKHEWLARSIMTLALVAAGCQAGGGDDRGRGSSTKPDPVITFVSPDSGDAAGGETVTIVTDGFEQDFLLNVPRVFFDTAEATSVTPIDASSISVVTPADPNSSGTRSVDLRVQSASGAQVAVLSARFTFIAPAAACLTVTPDTGSVFGGDQVIVTMLGPCFLDPSDPSAVFFGANPAVNITFINATSLTCTTPVAAAPGPVDVMVTGKDASGMDCVCTQAGGYTYQ